MPTRKQIRIITRAARKYGIRPETLYGVWGAETNYGQHPTRVSSAGAQGDFQFMPPTARAYGINPWNFRQSAFAAAKYLGSSKRAGKSFGRMLSDYNAGPAGAFQPDYVASVRDKMASWPGAQGGGGRDGGKRSRFKSNITAGIGLLSAFGGAQAQEPSKYEAYLETVGKLNEAARPLFDRNDVASENEGPEFLTSLQDSTDDLLAQNEEFIQQLRQLNSQPVKPPDREASRFVPKDAPAKLQTIIERAAKMDKMRRPYVWGGGHGATPDYNGPWDCSGAVSAVLGVNPRVSGAFAAWGKPGRGRHVTIYANSTHVLMEINGKFFGTSGSNPGGGAGWIPASVVSKAYLSRFSKRHPAGL